MRLLMDLCGCLSSIPMSLVPSVGMVGSVRAYTRLLVWSSAQNSSCRTAMRTIGWWPGSSRSLYHGEFPQAGGTYVPRQHMDSSDETSAQATVAVTVPSSRGIGHPYTANRPPLAPGFRRQRGVGPQASAPSSLVERLQSCGCTTPHPIHRAGPNKSVTFSSDESVSVGRASFSIERTSIP